MIVASDIGPAAGGVTANGPFADLPQTIEGAIGGFPQQMGLVWPTDGLVLHGLPACCWGLIALFALVGDLTESMMKRDAE